MLRLRARLRHERFRHVLTQSMRPADEQALSALVAEAARTRTPIEVLGAGSKRGIGRPMQTAASVTTGAMRGITLYEPTELVMSARAGTPLAEIEAELARNRQMLAFEPPDPGALTGGALQQVTIGGVFATNLSGARRINAGAARDHLLGIRAVTGTGQVFRSGGRVMKNVTGYDLCRAVCGSWGTLAVMTEVTFKVLPAAEETATLCFFGHPDEIAAELMCSAVASPFEISGAVHLQAAMVSRLRQTALKSYGRPLTAIRLESFARFLGYRKQRLAELLKPYGAPLELDHQRSLAFWEELRSLSVLQGSSAPLWRISTGPLSGPKVAAQIRGYMDARIFYDWSGGLMWVEVLDTADAGAADIRRVLSMHGGHATLVRAGPDVRQAVETFQPLEAGVAALTRGIKATFDPVGILNPGRMYTVS